MSSPGASTGPELVQLGVSGTENSLDDDYDYTFDRRLQDDESGDTSIFKGWGRTDSSLSDGYTHISESWSKLRPQTILRTMPPTATDTSLSNVRLKVGLRLVAALLILIGGLALAFFSSHFTTLLITFLVFFIFATGYVAFTLRFCWRIWWRMRG